MIEVTGLSKRYGDVVAVDDLSFTVPPGQVTGFLGPNGSGKSTTMRVILGLDAPTSGSASISGRTYTTFDQPLSRVGALLDATAVHPGRSACNHLRSLAFSNGISRERIAQVLDLVGLGDVAGHRVGAYSLGMKQRLGIASALLGDPKVLILDEPVNGLDPEGVHWLRTLLRSLAAEGRTILLSSHLMSEMALTADRLVILGRGRLIAETTMAELLARDAKETVRVRSPQSETLAELVEARGATVTRQPEGMLSISGISTDAVGSLALANGVVMQELSTDAASLENVYLDLTSDAVDFASIGAGE